MMVRLVWNICFHWAIAVFIFCAQFSSDTMPVFMYALSMWIRQRWQWVSFCLLLTYKPNQKCTSTRVARAKLRYKRSQINNWGRDATCLFFQHVWLAFLLRLSLKRNCVNWVSTFLFRTAPFLGTETTHFISRTAFLITSILKCGCCAKPK